MKKRSMVSAVLVSVGLTFGFVGAADARPVFDGTSLGIECSRVYGEYQLLLAKGLRGQLSDAERTRMRELHSYYNAAGCARYYGSIWSKTDVGVPSVPTSGSVLTARP